jgi:ankyrin repeat protein
VDDDGITPLIAACENEDGDVVDEIMSHYYCSRQSTDDKKWWSARNLTGHTALSIAVQNNEFYFVQMMHFHCGNRYKLPLVTDEDGKTPLHHARTAKIAKLLLEDYSAATLDNAGYTALMYACKNGDIDAMKYLMNLDDANIDAMADDGHTALTLAVSCDIKQFISEILLSAVRPPIVNLQHRVDGRTALFHAVRLCLPQQINILLNAGADPRIADNQGQIPLMVAAGVQDVAFSLMEPLVRAAPDTVNHRDERGRTVLSYLSGKHGTTGAISALFDCAGELNVDIDINAKQIDGDTALHYAMLAGCPDTVRLLLDKGAEVLGGGRGDTTVIMKPFWDRNEVSSDFDGIVGPYSAAEHPSETDAQIDACLRMVLSMLQLRSNTVNRWAVWRNARSGAREEESAAKRRKIE